MGPGREIMFSIMIKIALRVVAPTRASNGEVGVNATRTGWRNYDKENNDLTTLQRTSLHSNHHRKGCLLQTGGNTNWPTYVPVLLLVVVVVVAVHHLSVVGI